MGFTILIVKNVNHLLDESFPSGFAFSGVLLCCVLSVLISSIAIIYALQN